MSTAQRSVRVTLTVTVDPEAWDLTYGTGTGRAEIAGDVRAYVLTNLNGSPAAEETGLVAYLVQ